MRCRPVEIAALVLSLILFLFGPGAATTLALEPDQILLIVNRNVPESGKLAELYCQLRQIPPDRIVSLDLPDDAEIPFDTYEMQVVDPIRRFMTDHQLRANIKCLVSFYGVPLRIANKQNTPLEDQELQTLRDRRQTVMIEAGPDVADLEKQAAAADGAFSPLSGDSADELLRRSRWALAAIGRHLHIVFDPAARSAALEKILPVMQKLGGLAEVDSLVGESRRQDPTATAEQRAEWISVHENIRSQLIQMGQWQTRRWDAEARANLRKVAADYFGLLAEAKTLDAEINYLTTPDTGAAVDSELTLLWTDYYPRQHWLVNPLYWRNQSPAPQALMVMRLDAPEAPIVEQMMRTSIAVEKTGLVGKVALDARGLQPFDENQKPVPLGIYDQKIRDLAQFLQSKTKLQIKLDNEPGVFSPHSVNDVALYCGWYSVNHYVPGCDFNPGAVGFHIASYELVTLRHTRSRWVGGLLHDGVVGTLGAVAEPDLAAFPDPQDYFPLLLTGKFTLAEVYWKTAPTVSWMMDCVGDPLYTPYKANPALKMEDLPAIFRASVTPPKRGPITRAVDSSLKDE
jgi:uncharacterized protein (TIGR03790 family)